MPRFPGVEPVSEARGAAPITAGNDRRLASGLMELNTGYRPADSLAAVQGYRPARAAR